MRSTHLFICLSLWGPGFGIILGVVISLISHNSQTPIYTGWQMTQSFSWMNGLSAGSEWGCIRWLMACTRQLSWSLLSVDHPGKENDQNIESDKASNVWQKGSREWWMVVMDKTDFGCTVTIIKVPVYVFWCILPRNIPSKRRWILNRRGSRCWYVLYMCGAAGDPCGDFVMEYSSLHFRLWFSFISPWMKSIAHSPNTAMIHLCHELEWALSQ